ncbi:hypothetical protein QVD17_11390 [Tagetes erecta]|uniref:DUF868 family protein n=1 Tax=Tagetes erecta TaxID=13708 RepID=A0AAD8KY25_TARER|nr:hypothetical protein QVD17_11390 [Tagetes erecta]
MGLISCYSELTVQLSQKSLCSNHKNIVSNSISPSLTPSIQTVVTNLYTTTLSTGIRHLITVTWCRNTTTQGFEINSGDDPTTGFRLNTNSRFFRKKKGSKSFEINDSKFEVFYDLSSAQYATGAEPVERYYVVILVDSELGLFLGDMLEAFFKKVKINKQNVKFNLISRRECIYGNTLYSTKARFSDTGECHDILIQCTGEGNGVVKRPCLLVSIDKRVVVRVKRLQWNFRGNQTIFVDGLSVDLMWDVHDWFFTSRCGSGSGSGHGVFMFRVRNGLDSMLWLEDKKKIKDEKKEFTLLVYAIKS